LLSGARRHAWLDYDPTLLSSWQSHIYTYSRNRRKMKKTLHAALLLARRTDTQKPNVTQGVLEEDG